MQLRMPIPSTSTLKADVAHPYRASPLHPYPPRLPVRQAAIDARLWRLLAPPSMWHYAPKERRLVLASEVEGAVVNMMAAGQLGEPQTVS